MRTWERTWHLIFLAHMWALSPFAIVWLTNPSVANELPVKNMEQMKIFTLGVFAYFVVRTILALINPKWLKWPYVFPPIDVTLITVMLTIGDRDPVGNITILYVLPIAEAVGTLNVIYAASISLLSIGGCLMGALNIAESRPYHVAFRFAFLVVIASLFTLLARQAAEFWSRGRVAAHRNRLAMEMHDGVQAQLIAAASQLELVQHLAPTQGRRAAELALESRSTLRQAADELRFLVQRLRSPALGEGFLPALRQYAHNFCERFGLDLHFEVSGETGMLNADQEQGLFRIAQESLTNVVKHAKAKSVAMRLVFTAREARLFVADDGIGIPAGAHSDQCVGLENMIERAKSLGGSLEVKPNGDRGTTIAATIPLGRRMKTGVKD